MKVALKEFQEEFKEQKAVAGIDPVAINEYIKKFYGQEPEYYSGPPYEIQEIKAQVQKICEHTKNLGLDNFAVLIEKFTSPPHKKEEAELLGEIKRTMEAILYQMEHSELPSTDIANKFKDRVFVCQEGTLSNLQGILAEMSLGSAGIDAHIVEQKRQLITQTAVDMYRNNSFIEFPWPLRQFKGMEIHNIASLVNTIAPQYGLLVKSKAEDKYLRSISSFSKRKLENALEKHLQSVAVVDSFIDGIAMNVVQTLPHYEKDKYAIMPNQFNEEVIDAIKTLNLGNIIQGTALIEMEGYNPKGYKSNRESIIKDAVTIYLHEKGVVTHPEIELVKLRISLESGQNINGDSSVSKEAIDQAAAKGYLEIAMKYTIDNNLKLDIDDFSTIDPVKYAIEHTPPIMIDGKEAKQYALENIIERYLKTSDPKIKKELEARYKEIHQVNVKTPVELLSIDSNIGRFLDNENNIKLVAQHEKVKGKTILSDVDFTKCDLPLIEKCFNFMKKSEHEVVRNYDSLTTNQKIGLAFSIALGPLAILATYYGIKKHNQHTKKALENKLDLSLDSINQDIKKISKHNPSEPTFSLEVSTMFPQSQKEVSTEKHTTKVHKEKIVGLVKSLNLKLDKKPHTLSSSLSLARNNDTQHGK